ncbi:hypothetical protein ElyMa_001942700 [Elysia marginata]|uniref:Uncharacterized protein n=1 Tax=Elysia marginata TaxID=1093978 RepID=A0AAV4EX16_9GAST|nr:hypothetical protein ElyMa_001942700 [Elysia marginata]
MKTTATLWTATLLAARGRVLMANVCVARTIQAASVRSAMNAIPTHVKMVAYAKHPKEGFGVSALSGSEARLVRKPFVTDQLNPAPGSTINCKVNTPCGFPVFTTSDNSGTPPEITPGPKTPDINVTIDPTIPNNGTQMPGITFLTPVTTTSPMPGHKELCLNVGSNQ